MSAKINLKLAAVLAMVCVVLGALATTALAQNAPANPLPNSLTVDGAGQAFGAPDIAYVQLGVQTTNTDVTTAFAEANDVMNQIIGAMTENGVDPNDLQTTGLYLYPEQQYDPQTGQPTATILFRVNNSVNVTVRDISKVATLISAGVEAGANNIGSLSFGLSEGDALEREARVAAVANARERAGQLAEAMGVQLGAPIVIVETVGGGQAPVFYERALAQSDGLGGAVVAEGQVSVSVQVKVTFAIS